MAKTEVEKLIHQVRVAKAKVASAREDLMRAEAKLGEAVDALAALPRKV